MRKDEKGYIVVETIGSFLMLVLLVTSILSLINIVTVQARVHYALTQAAETVSMYSYVLEAAGVADHMKNSSAQAEAAKDEIHKIKTNINGVIQGIQGLAPDQIGEYGAALAKQVNQAVSTPQQTVQMMMNYGLQEAGGEIFEKMIRPLVGHYLQNGSQSGDEYLKSAHVIGGLKGLDFYTFSLGDMNVTGNDDSVLLTSDGEVKLQVQYDVDYTFGALVFPFRENKLHITQTVVTKAWLNGKGEGYKK